MCFGVGGAVWRGKEAEGVGGEGDEGEGGCEGERGAAFGAWE